VPQKKRESLLAKFQKGQLEILVATDVAARGLHIDGVSHVYNYDLPFDAEDYVHRIGRTARLGAEGDAISFACERYAMSLPDIEAYIEQKVPTAPVEADLLVSRPRPKRELPEGAEGEEQESVGAIFREAREQRAAEEERRGGGRGRSGAGGSRSGGAGSRSSGGRSEAGSGSRRPRREKSATDGGKGASDAPHGEAPAAPKPRPQTAATVTDGVPADVAGEQRPPRKRRRRRGGRKLEGEGGNAVGQPAAGQQAAGQNQSSGKATQVAANKPQPASKPASGSGDKPGLLGRIKRGLQSMVTRGPNSQH